MSESPEPVEQAPENPKETRQAFDRRWLVGLFIKPVIFLVCGTLLFAGLGLMQRFGLISSGAIGGDAASASAQAGAEYICPMMCTPPSSQPGRCPVCAMELVVASSGGSGGDSHSIQIGSAARRIANIQTTEATMQPMTRNVRAIGKLKYDEASLKTISAYVGGRLDRLYADFTGVVVEQGEPLALLYSPDLYSAQVEYLLAKKSVVQASPGVLPSVASANRNLFENARQQLIELGMTEAQITDLEGNGKADSRLHLNSPMSGTVIQKMAVEGQYVKASDPIYQLADLSTVWLMLELFPEDAACIGYGEKVEAEVQSHPGKKFTGRVAFIDPNVNERTRTIGVRVALPNEEGLLKVGDFATAFLRIPAAAGPQLRRYDQQLANKWISPRFPNQIFDQPGKCPISNLELVHASHFGFADQPQDETQSVSVPRSAVLMAGKHSVVYVETEPGRFEIRRVVLGHQSGDQIAIHDGINPGEKVAIKGNFLIDSQMQLAGNPSLINPEKYVAPEAEELSPEMLAALEKLPPEEMTLASAQQICPVTEMALGSMGTPPKAEVNGRTVFLCCEGCRGSLMKEPEKYLAVLDNKDSGTQSESAPDLPPIGPIQEIPLVPELPPNTVAVPVESDGPTTPSIATPVIQPVEVVR
ncbi:efflux RND transporter periplasmic adaptor subunit [Bremerella sp. T1]|uniref:efflux RND transporter periplasmic adaptor subunit n=1 Tax=Bremerella sp. TYQ1 TaxID=3119568 RepID=UPI001CCB4072|nr:efflux RND transporter periplasmic adaptor subunit [Bremerella volcania]UBM36374.1 efflux RND transporter periplasmic adaptor subunit [Bremerella volcania]